MLQIAHEESIYTSPCPSQLVATYPVTPAACTLSSSLPVAFPFTRTRTLSVCDRASHIQQVQSKTITTTTKSIKQEAVKVKHLTHQASPHLSSPQHPSLVSPSSSSCHVPPLLQRRSLSHFTEGREVEEYFNHSEEAILLTGMLSPSS